MATLKEIVEHNDKLENAKSSLDEQIVKLPSFCVYRPDVAGALSKNVQKVACWFTVGREPGLSPPSGPAAYLHFRDTVLKESELVPFIRWLAELLGLRVIEAKGAVKGDAQHANATISQESGSLV